MLDSIPGSGDNTVPRDNNVEMRQLAELYIVVKETIIFFEEVNPDQKTDIQPINELRNAFDHLMRATAVRTGLKKEENPDDYICKQLDKSYGHVYRAGYDTVDFLCLTLKGYISKALNGYHTNSIREAIPEYYSEIKPKITKLENEITKYRSKKDVGENNHERLLNYIAVARDLGNLRARIDAAIPSILELEAQRTNDSAETQSQQQSTEIRGIKSKIVLLVIGAILTLVFQAAYDKIKEASTLKPAIPDMGESQP